MTQVVNSGDSALVQVAFDYSSIDAETTNYLKQSAQETRKLFKRTTEDIIKIGQNLLEAKERLPHGQFVPWIKAEFDISQPTAWRFMRAAQGKEIKKKSFTVNDLVEQISAPGPHVGTTSQGNHEQETPSIVEKTMGGDIDSTNSAIYAEKTKGKLDSASDIVDSQSLETIPINLWAPIEKRNAFNPSSGERNNEWYTEARYVKAAREVMGSIDLDPASNAIANMTVNATRYYTKEEDGLCQDWVGNCWINPPYGRVEGKSMIYAFIDKLIREYNKGNVEQAVILTPADTDEKWFQMLWDYPICFANHKLSFDRPNQEKSRQFFGTAFAYLGHDRERFIDIFEQFGPVAARMRSKIYCQITYEVA